MFGVKLRVTLVLYALSLLFLMLMLTSILSLFALIFILEKQMKAVSVHGCDAHISPQGYSLALEGFASNANCFVRDIITKI